MNIVLKGLLTVVMMLVWAIGKEVAQKVQGSGFGFLTLIVSLVCTWVIYDIWFGGVLSFKKIKKSDDSVSKTDFEVFGPHIKHSLKDKSFDTFKRKCNNESNFNLSLEKDKLFYLYADKEINSINIDHALWTKCITLCEGDEIRAKYMYIKIRVEILKQKYVQKFINKNKINQKNDDKLIIFGVFLFLIVIICMLFLV